MNGNIDLYLAGTTLLDDVIYDSSTPTGTYDIPSNANLIYVEGQGAGAGGGGGAIIDDVGTWEQAAGGAGGAGGFVAAIVYLGETYIDIPFTVGSGGTGGNPEHASAIDDTNTKGSNGGETIFGNSAIGEELFIACKGEKGSGGYVTSSGTPNGGTQSATGTNTIDTTWGNKNVNVIILSDISGSYGGKGGEGVGAGGNDSSVGDPGSDPGIIGVGAVTDNDDFGSDSDWASGGSGGTSWTGKGGDGGIVAYDSASVFGGNGSGFGAGGGGGSTAANTIPYAGGGGNGAGGYLRIQAYYGDPL